MTTHTPTPSTSSGGKTRKQLITILVLLVLIILAMVVFLITKISGDRGGDSAAAEGSASSSSENGDAQVQAQAEKAVVVYKQVLANPAPLQTFVGEVSPGGAMKYALVHLDDGCVPELVLNYGTSAMSAEIDAIGVYGVDENGQEIQFQNSYHDGAASAGGVRRALQRATGQPGMFSFSAERGGRNQEDLLVTRQGNELVETPANPGAGEFEQFNWIPADNLESSRPLLLVMTARRARARARMVLALMVVTVATVATVARIRRRGGRLRGRGLVRVRSPGLRVLVRRGRAMEPAASRP